MNPNLSFAHLANFVKENEKVSVICEKDDFPHTLTRLARVGV